MEVQPLKVHWYTDRGRRPANEDAVLVEALFGDRDLVAVADGMGGHAGGEVASEKALQTLLAYLESHNDLAEAVRRANQALLRAADENPEWKGMGTTLVALLRVGTRYHVANVGDSRAYRLDGSGIRQITEDHSFTAEAISSGRLSEDEAERSPWRNALTRAVGTDQEVEVDVFGPFDVEPAHRVIICTDGLYRVMEDEELAEELLELGHQPDSARNLVADALRRGSSDNISVAVVEFGDVEASVAAPPVTATSDSTAETSRGSGDREGEWVLEETAEPLPAAPVVPVAELAPSERKGTEDDPGPYDSLPGDEPPVPAVDPLAVEDAPVAGAGLDPGQGPVDPVALSAGDDDRPGTEAATGRSGYRPARKAQVRRSRSRSRPLTRRRSRPPGLPPWFKRELLPALVLIGLTAALVFVLTSILG